jgi:hypothetical protein
MVVMTTMAITEVMDIMATIIKSKCGFDFDIYLVDGKDDTISLFSESILFVSL